MDNVQIIVIGASGFIGRHIYMFCKKNGIKVIGTYFRNKIDCHYIKFDMRKDSYTNIKKLFDNKETYVIICGANSSIDSCFCNEVESNQLNVNSTKGLIDEIDGAGHKIIFLSSEAVFDGKKGLYTEDTIPLPTTLYGRQKLEIERYLEEHCKDSLIFRISRACGDTFGEKDIFHDFYTKIINGQEIVCLKNQSFSLTYVDDISKVILASIHRKLEGVYHIASNNYISRYDLARYYAYCIFGGYEKIYEKEYSELSFKDDRPVWLGLNGNKLSQEIGVKYKSLCEILECYKRTYILNELGVEYD